MKAYVLNLARREDRLRRFLGWNGAHGLDIQVVPAVDGATVDRSALVGQGLLDEDNRAFTDGALGAALSHRRQWQDCVADGQPRLVLEDDACLRGDVGGRIAALAGMAEKCEVIFLGHNTDAPVTVMLPDGLVAALYFGLSRDGGADFYADFAAAGPPRPVPALHPAAMVWGCIAYVVSPAGAARLLSACFPLSSRDLVQVHSERRAVRPDGIDGMMNLALQRAQVRGMVCFPPLALSPNDLSDISSPSSRR